MISLSSRLNRLASCMYGNRMVTSLMYVVSCTLCFSIISFSFIAFGPQRESSRSLSPESMLPIAAPMSPLQVWPAILSALRNNIARGQRQIRVDSGRVSRETAVDDVPVRCNTVHLGYTPEVITIACLHSSVPTVWIAKLTSAQKCNSILVSWELKACLIPEVNNAKLKRQASREVRVNVIYSACSIERRLLLRVVAYIYIIMYPPHFTVCVGAAY